VLWVAFDRSGSLRRRPPRIFAGAWTRAVKREWSESGFSQMSTSFLVTGWMPAPVRDIRLELRVGR
jgi:hypothetical protein